MGEEGQGPQARGGRAREWCGGEGGDGDDDDAAAAGDGGDDDDGADDGDGGDDDGGASGDDGGGDHDGGPSGDGGGGHHDSGGRACGNLLTHTYVKNLGEHKVISKLWRNRSPFLLHTFKRALNNLQSNAVQKGISGASFESFPGVHSPRQYDAY